MEGCPPGKRVCLIPDIVPPHVGDEPDRRGGKAMKACHCCGNKHTEAGKYCPDCHTCLEECDWRETEEDLEALGLIDLKIIFEEEGEEERGWPPGPVRYRT